MEISSSPSSCLGKAVHHILHGHGKLLSDFALCFLFFLFGSTCLNLSRFSFKKLADTDLALSPWFVRYFRNAKNLFAFVVSES